MAAVHDLGGRPVIVGGGLAGLMVALQLAPMPVALLVRAPLGAEAASGWAQGGIAAAVGADDDAALHVADTLAAGDGLCDADAVRRIVEAGPAAIERLVRLGVRFDRGADGALRLGREAAHRRRRIVHADGDGTGREVMRALTEAVRATPSIQVLEGVEARRLILHDGAVAGVLAAGPGGAVVLRTGRVVLATGGVGGLFLHTTNPAGALGQGVALAARAGAELADMEFVQFHPTALETRQHALMSDGRQHVLTSDGRQRPMALVSEAVRGEGAVLIDETGARFMADVPGAELAPRDVVARAVWRHLAEGHRVFLDASAALGRRFAARFPGVDALCRAAGIDPATQPIPVRPAAHYHMGGVRVDAGGRSTVPGLWACGEVACTGMHGANRLASNSLLEAAVCAGFVAESVAGTPAARPRPVRVPPLPPAPDATAVRPILSRAAGVLREAGALGDAAGELLDLVRLGRAAADPAAVALAITVAALRREGDCGAHCRTDDPGHRDAAVQPRTLSLADALNRAEARTPRPAPLTRKA